MCNLKDTLNLRANNNFATKISNGLWWVSTNSLGNTRYSVSELRRITSKMGASDLQNMKLNLYESIELFQMVRVFSETNDIIIYDNGIFKWQLHKSGRFAVETNCGCCSSAASWLNYIIKKSYPIRGYIQMIRPNGSGHIVNYIKHNDFYYIIDMSTQIYNNANNVPIESGNLKDYRSSKFYTGICYKANSLMDFVNYHNRIQMTGGFEFSYFMLPAYEAIPPTYTYIDNKNICHFYTVGCYQSLRYSNICYSKIENFKLPQEFIKYSSLYF